MQSFATAYHVRKSIIGGNHTLQGPLGRKPIIYADSTASGKAVNFIENYIHDCVLPFYGNTHTESSVTGLQTTKFREDARDCIRTAFNAPVDEYAIIFTGSGSTGAINKLANILGISPLAPKVENAAERAVIFISAQEHHSNELLWRESGNVDCVVIPHDPRTGMVSEIQLEKELKRYQARPLKLGSFSAASNVTGIRCNTKGITRILHQQGALAAFDFAAAGPHVGIDMKNEGFDAIYVSPHKYVGGPGTPGLLVARRDVLQNKVPVVPGGGTVLYVQPHGHKYVEDSEQREEGGTPAIVESIRCGLVLQLHHQIGTDWIEKKENAFLQRALATWQKNPHITILGDTKAPRVPIVSFLVHSPEDPELVLHHTFIAAVLNDLFGIQTRGGCACAGPYGHFLLDISREQSDHILQGMERIGEILKPGWTRLSFSYYMADEVVDYIIKAVDMIANDGYKLLPHYRIDAKSGSWVHREQKQANSNIKSLWDFSSSYQKLEKHTRKNLKGCLKMACKLFDCPPPRAERVRVRLLNCTSSEPADEPLSDGEDDQWLQWFVVSKELQDITNHHDKKTTLTIPEDGLAMMCSASNSNKTSHHMQKKNPFRWLSNGRTDQRPSRRIAPSDLLPGLSFGREGNKEAKKA